MLVTGRTRLRIRKHRVPDHDDPVPVRRHGSAGGRGPAVPTRSPLRQVLNAAGDVGADYGGYLLLISVFKCPDKSLVLPDRFLVRPPGLRAMRERPPQQPHEEKKHRRARAFVDPKVKLPAEFRQPAVIRQARRNLPVAGFDIRDVIVGDPGHRKGFQPAPPGRPRSGNSLPVPPTQCARRWPPGARR
jgi:hypothetical protein